MSASNSAMPWAIFHHDNGMQIVTERSNRPFKHNFWKVMIHVYNCSLYDLFTYGLQIDQPDNESIAGNLCEIFPHEVFKGDASLLRWILEQSIFKRVNGYVHSIGKINQRNISSYKIPASTNG